VRGVAGAVGWHQVPWALGCFGRWTDGARKQHYQNLSAIDGRIVLAGDHVSYIPAWQEGRGFVLARRDLAPAPARFGELTMSSPAWRSCRSP
jgi:hypothetical protein